MATRLKRDNARNRAGAASFGSPGTANPESANPDGAARLLLIDYVVLVVELVKLLTSLSNRLVNLPSH